MSVSKSDIDKPFKLNGLILAPDASGYLLQIVQRVEAPKRQKVLKRLVDTILKQKIDDNRITKSLCELAVNECKADHNVDHPVLYVINAFSVPRFYFSQTLRKFVPLDTSQFDGEHDSVFPATAQLKCFLYANRYEVVYQRVLRNQLFSESATQLGSNVAQAAGYRIQPVEYLLSSATRIESVIVLGMLCQIREGNWHLEDPTGVVRLSLTETTFHEGLFPEGCIVLVEGWYEDKVLHVTDLGLPPCETSDATRRSFSVSNPFGGGTAGCLAAAQDPRMHRLLTTTQAGADAMLVLLGETHLDSVDCMDKLRTLFTGYSAYPPVAFVITGNFLSSDTNGRSRSERFSTLRQLLRQLITLFRNAFPELDDHQVTVIPQLILVPGPDDPVGAPSKLLPQPGFPSDLVVDSCPAWLHLCSNPCRIRLYTREVVVFRSQYNRLLLRHCIYLPMNEQSAKESVASMVDLDSQTQNDPLSQDVSELRSPIKVKSSSELLGMGLARCLASQNHLLPLTGHIAPIYWSYDQALSLHPLPNLVVAVEPRALADLNGTEADPVKTGNCRFINPGQFGHKVTKGQSSQFRMEYAFKVYYPLTGVVENSCLPE